MPEAIAFICLAIGFTLAYREARNFTDLPQEDERQF